MHDLIILIGLPILAFGISKTWRDYTDDTLSYSKPVLYHIGNNIVDLITVPLSFLGIYFLMHIAEFIMGGYFMIFKFSSFLPMDFSSVMEMAAESAFPKSYSFLSVIKNIVFSIIPMGLWWMIPILAFYFIINSRFVGIIFSTAFALIMVGAYVEPIGDWIISYVHISDLNDLFEQCDLNEFYPAEGFIVFFLGALSCALSPFLIYKARRS